MRERSRWWQWRGTVWTTGRLGSITTSIDRRVERRGDGARPGTECRWGTVFWICVSLVSLPNGENRDSIASGRCRSGEDDGMGMVRAVDGAAAGATSIEGASSSHGTTMSVEARTPRRSRRRDSRIPTRRLASKPFVVGGCAFVWNAEEVFFWFFPSRWTRLSSLGVGEARPTPRGSAGEVERG